MFENIAADTLANGGATFDSKGNAITSGWSVGGLAPAVKVRKDLFTAAWLASVIRFFAGTAGEFGTWEHEGMVWIEPVQILPSDQEAEALTLGRERNQVSIFHLDTLTEAPTGGTGEV